MKGTYIKVLNDYIFDELDEIKARKNLKGKGDAHPDEAKNKKWNVEKNRSRLRMALLFCAKSIRGAEKWYHSRF